MGKFMLSMMLPMMLIIFAASGPIAAATDLGAGEKERGTLEPLLTTQASRMSLLWGKFLAITVMGILTTLAFLGGLIISMKMSPNMFAGMKGGFGLRSEEHTSELQSRQYLVCRLLLEKKKKSSIHQHL